MTHAHKDWTPDAAAKTQAILARAEAQKPSWIRKIDGIIYWVMLIISILANFILSVALVPFLLVLRGWTLYLVLLFVGLSFGWMFSFILHSMERLQKEKHIIASIFIPCLALINVGMFAILSNKLIILLKLTTPPHNPLLVGAAYVFGYVLPEAIVHYQQQGKKFTLS